MLFCMKKQKEQNKIHARISISEGEPLSQAETRNQLAALFAILLEMEMDQQNVTKEYKSAK